VRSSARRATSSPAMHCGYEDPRGQPPARLELLRLANKPDDHGPNAPDNQDAADDDADGGK
jgi:hypothetical protein